MSNLEKLIAALLKGARSVGGLKREGIADAMELAAQYPQMFRVSEGMVTPVLSLRYE